MMGGIGRLKMPALSRIGADRLRAETENAALSHQPLHDLGIRPRRMRPVRAKIGIGGT
ncbi:hypothetical protein D3C87_2124010 [compost metagenome]